MKKKKPSDDNGNQPIVGYRAFRVENYVSLSISYFFEYMTIEENIKYISQLRKSQP